MDGVTRTVWDGDRVLKEIRAPWHKMEQDTGYVGGWAESSQYGQVLLNRVGFSGEPDA